MFIAQADKHQYDKQQEDIENTFIWGNNDYPESMVQAFKLWNKFKNWQLCIMVPDAQATAFALKGKSRENNGGPKDDDDWQKTATCHHCHKKGHIRPNYAKLKKEDSDDEEASSTLKSNKSHSKKKKQKSQDDKKVALAQCNNPDDNSDNDDSKEYDFCNVKWADKKNLKLLSCILLNNQLMVIHFCNKRLVSHIWDMD